MSAYSSKRFTASTAVTADTVQRDTLIAQLRSEILDLKQNEREYFDLAAQLKKLEQRYNLLQDDTARSEADFKSRNTQNFEAIVGLRTDMDTLKANIADAKIEIQDLRVENQTFKALAEQRTSEVQAAKRDVGMAAEDNAALTDVRRKLQGELDIAREENRKFLSQIKGSRATLDDLDYKNAELEKIMKEMEYRNSQNEKQSRQLQQSIDSMHDEVKTRNLNLESIQQQVSDSQKAITSIDRDILELQKEQDRNRSENNQKQRLYQDEVTRSLDLEAKSTLAETTLRAREKELIDLKRDYENLKNAHSNLIDTSFQLKQDLDSIRGDMDSMTNQNSDIVEELGRLTEENEQVRALLNRSERVETLKYKSEIQIRKSAVKSRSQLSPSPDRGYGGLSGRRSPLRESSLKKSTKY